MFSPETERDIEQGIETKKAQREDLDREIRLLQDTLNVVQRDRVRQDIRAMPPTAFSPLVSEEPDDLPEYPPSEPPAYLPKFSGWSYSYRLTKAMIDLLLEERPLKRETLIGRLREQGLDEKPTQDFGGLVSSTLSRDPRFVRCYRNGFWTLPEWAVAMGSLTAPDDSQET